MNTPSISESQLDPVSADMDSREARLMAGARSAATVDSNSLANIIHKGPQNVQVKRKAWTRLENAIGSSDTSRLPSQYAKTSREELFEDGLREGKVAREDMKEHGHTLFDSLTPRYRLSNYSPYGLTTLLIKPTFEQMATPEQRQKWNLEDLNFAYAQTELGHGTFVRGLETTATFDPAQDAFIIHSPNTTSTKYWPGSLAFSATHAVVMAKLVIDGKDYSVHAFIIQLRASDGSALPGIELGDIGVMSSYNQNDNGYAVFTHVKIPRENMLAAQASVTEQGEYHKHVSHSKSSYTTMLAGRTAVARAACFQLAQAVTIAIRYSTVRLQGYPAFAEESMMEEVSLFHFRSQQYRLLTNLANAYAILFAIRRCERAQEAFVSTRDFSAMTDLHALTAGMKAWTTATALEGANVARQACGGHGYLGMSGLPDIVGAVDALCTLEGDNVVMLLQTARWLMKMASSDKNKLPVEVAYLVAEPTTTAVYANIFDPRVQNDLFTMRAIKAVGDAVRVIKESQKAKSEAWNDNSQLLLSSAKNHISLLVHQEFVSQISALPVDRTKEVLQDLCTLFAVTQFSHDPFLAEDCMQGYVNTLLSRLAPEAIALTDGFDFSDASLASAIGMRDGRVYERLMSWTKQLPMNQKDGREAALKAKL